MYEHFYWHCLHRLVFSRIFYIHRNLGNMKEKPTRKTCFSSEIEAPGFIHLPWKILLGCICLMSTEFLLKFHGREMLKRGRIYEKFLKRESKLVA